MWFPTLFQYQIDLNAYQIWSKLPGRWIAPSVTRLLVQDNIKKKNRRQNQLGWKKKVFQLSVPFLYCLSNSKLLASKLAWSWIPSFKSTNFSQKLVITHTKKLFELLYVTHTSLFSFVLSCLLSSLPSPIQCLLWKKCQKQA